MKRDYNELNEKAAKYKAAYRKNLAFIEGLTERKNEDEQIGDRIPRRSEDSKRSTG